MIKTSESSIRRYERGEREIPEGLMEKVREISSSITADSVRHAGERIKTYRLGLSGAAFRTRPSLVFFVTAVFRFNVKYVLMLRVYHIVSKLRNSLF